MRSLLFVLVCTLAAVEPRIQIAPNATVQKAASGYDLTSGVAVGQDGLVYFSDLPSDRILVRALDGTVTTWLEESGGANGLVAFAGQVYACQGSRRQVVAITAAGEVKPLSYQSAGKRFNAPDDLWIDDAGGVYFTDPRADISKDVEHVFYIAPGVVDAKPVATDFIAPSGIVGTGNGRTLYVADQQGAAVYRFNIAAPGQLVDRMKFCSEGSNGMCLDDKGNLYLTWKQGIQVYSPDGTKLGTIPMPVEPTNIAFGGPTRSTLFITGGGTLHTLEMVARGVQATP